MLVDYLGDEMSHNDIQNDDSIQIDDEYGDDQLFSHRMDEWVSETVEERAKRLIHMYSASPINHKLADYLSEGSFDVLKFWMVSKDTFEELYRLATLILASPASSVPSEQCFSRANYLINPRRNRLASKHVNSMLVLQSVYSQ